MPFLVHKHICVCVCVCVHPFRYLCMYVCDKLIKSYADQQVYVQEYMSVLLYVHVLKYAFVFYSNVHISYSSFIYVASQKGSVDIMVYIYLTVTVCFCEYMYFYSSLYTYKNELMYVQVYKLINMLCVYMVSYTYKSMCYNICICIHNLIYKHLHIWVWICVSTPIHICLSVCMHACKYTSVIMFECIHIHVWEPPFCALVSLSSLQI